LKYSETELNAGEITVTPTVPQPIVTTSSQIATFCGANKWASNILVDKVLDLNLKVI
jgi:hypothetical protein